MYSHDNSTSIKSNQNMVGLLSCGFIRKYLNKKNINHIHVGKLIAMFLNEAILWKFDFCFDAKNRGLSKIHCIKNKGKTLKCSYNDRCYCFFASCIENLPKNTIFYWFVGHVYSKMSVTVVE